MFDMIRQAQAMKEKVAEFQKAMESQSFTGTAGGGAVSVTINGKHEVRSVTIDPKVVASGNTDMLQDLVKTAVNQAGQEANGKMKAEISKMTGGLLPGLF
ncbi:MAG TPA: YbaB/EbfC family nucleoid-associated protein [bacterium]|nr:YbaB/EbfC family nucleoid-associated protein [bacterium]